MGLVERLNELGLMRQNGQISDAEYALLVESATKNFGKENEVANPVASESILGTSKLSSQSKSLAMGSKIVGVGVVVVLIFAFLAFSQGRGGDSPVVSETQISMTAKTEPVSNDVKFRKPRIEIHLKRSRSNMAWLKERKEQFRVESRTLFLQDRNSWWVLGATISLTNDVEAAFEEFPELASASREITAVLKQYKEVFMRIKEEARSGRNTSSIFSQADELWSMVIEAQFNWEKALQKLIDESP